MSVALEEALFTASVGISVRILRIAWTGSKIQIFSHIIAYLLACRLKNCRGSKRVRVESVGILSVDKL